MEDHFNEHYEFDEHGVPRKKKRVVLPDGASMHVPMRFYDGRFVDHFADGTTDLTSPHRKGFRFADTDDRIAADAAYSERSRRIGSAWRNKDDDAKAEDIERVTLDQLEARAALAYSDRTARLQNAWRQR